jgi:hypothetical protein
VRNGVMLFFNRTTHVADGNRRVEAMKTAELNKLCLLLASVALLLNEAATAQTYWQSPFTGDGAPCVRRTDLGRLPDTNDFTSSLVTTRERINEGYPVPTNDQKYLGWGAAQREKCITDHVYGTRCGATQINLILPFWPKSATATKINIIFETLLMRFHFYHESAPYWIGTRDDGLEYKPYPEEGYPNFCRVWNTGHPTRNNVSLVFMPPWPNAMKEGAPVLLLIDPQYGGGRNRMWVVAEPFESQPTLVVRTEERPARPGRKPDQ